MDKKTEIQLLFASFLSVLGGYLLFAAYQLLHFAPDLAPLKALSLNAYEVQPEIEIPLYIFGCVVITVFSIVIFLLLRKHFSYHHTTRSSNIGLFLRIMIFVNLWLLYELAVVHRFDVTLYKDTVVYFLTLIISFTILLVFPKGSRFIERLVFILDHVILSILVLVIIFGLVMLFSHKYDAQIITFLVPPWDTDLWINKLPSLYLFCISGIMAIFFYIWFKKPAALNFTSNKYFKILFYSSIIIYIVLIETVTPDCLMFGRGRLERFCQQMHPYLDPVNDIYGGKTPLINSPFQYGLMVIYTLAGVYRIIPLSYNNNFLLAIYGATVIAYIAIFLVLSKEFGWGMAFLAMILIAQPLWYYEAVLRFGWWVILLTYIFFSTKLNLRIKRIFELVLPGYAFFWASDTGTYALGAYAGYIFVSEYLIWKARDKKIAQLIISLLKRYAIVVLSLLIFFTGISAFTFFRSGLLPDWSKFFHSTKMFSSGYGMRPLPPIGPHLIIFGIYFMMIIYITYKLFGSFNRKMTDGHIRKVSIISFVTFYSMLQIFYYLGRSLGGNLQAPSIPIFILACWLIYFIRSYFLSGDWKSLSIQIKTIFSCFAVIIFTLISIYLTATSLIYYKVYVTKPPFWPQFDEAQYKGAIKTSVDYINNYLSGKTSPNRRIAIISWNDNYIYVKTRSVNFMDLNNIDYYDYRDDTVMLGKQLAAAKPDVIFLMHEYQISEKLINIFSFVKDDYHFVKNIGHLDVWERNKI